MQIQIVTVFKCIINTVLAIIGDESVSEIVSKKSLLIHTAPQTALRSTLTTWSKSPVGLFDRVKVTVLVNNDRFAKNGGLIMQQLVFKHLVKMFL